jgi:VanZ family protein
MSSDAIRFQRIACYATWFCVGIIIILSLLPGSARPHTGFAGKIEHMIAYAGTGAIAMIGYRLRQQRLMFWASVAGLSFLLEFLQQYVPGRGAAVLDAVASSTGLTVGMLLGGLFFALIG